MTQTYFVVGYRKFWTTPIHAVINRIRKRFGFNWLRISMAYKCHSNLAMSLMGDISSKLMVRIEDETWKDRECNCGLAFKRECTCIFGSRCREGAVVYKTTCRCCGSYYIGKTQRYLKVRIWEHIGI